MLGAVLSGIVIVAASLACGEGISRLAGRPSHSAVTPAAGLATLLVVCGVAVKVPGHAVTAAVAAGIAVAIALWALLRDPVARRELTGIRVGALVAVAGAALVTAIPFAASGRMGILGQGLVNDDMASHLLFAEWLQSHVGHTPDLIKDGYPLGPHAIVAAVTKVTGASLVEGFAGLTGAIAALTGLTAYAALAGARPLLRAPAAILVAFAYLAAAYLAQGAFKEPMLALALLGFSLALPALRRPGSEGAASATRARALAASPAAVIAAGTIYNYSFPGLGWLLAAAFAWLAIVAGRDRRALGGLRVRARLRAARASVAVLLAVPVAAAVPELFRLASFTSFKAFNPTGTGARVGLGNLRQPLSPLESLGIWPSSEFRITPANASAPELAFYLGALIALGALGWGLFRAIRRREAALPAALGAGAIGYLGALAAGTPYTQAKALAIAAPVVMLIALRGLLSADPVEGDEADAALAAQAGAAPDSLRRRRPLLRLGVPALGVAFVAAAAFSSLLPLRQAAVGPQGQAKQLMSMRSLLQGQDVLFLGRESFVAWELIGADVYAPIVHNYNVTEINSLYHATSTEAKFDFDVVPQDDITPAPPPARGDNRKLDSFDWVITTSAAEASEPPAAFQPRLRTRDYVLWHRVAPEGQRHTLDEPAGPGATVDCSQKGDRALASLRGTAHVFSPAPVVGQAWKPTADVTDAQPGSEELLLPPGRWAISLQYASTEPMTVRTARIPEGDGLDARMEPNLLFRGPEPYFPVGEIIVGGHPRLVHFDVTIDHPPAIGRLLGSETRAYLGPIAATPAPAETTVPLAKACGLYVDWYSVAPGTTRGELERVPHPVPHAVLESR
jgi:hypothetical protein